jgi:Mannosyl-glycoprotein endo-beta-N-acetylglucosaminidase
MFASRRGAVALIVVLIATLVAPAAAIAAPKTTTSKPKSEKKGPTKSTPGPTTTTIDPASVPPPPAFTLPIGLGLELLAQRDAANKDLFTYGAALPDDKAQLAVVQHSWDVLQLRLAKLRKQVRRTQHDLDVAHENLQAAAVEAYMNSGSDRLEAAITAIASARTAMDYSRTIHLIGSFGDRQDELIKEYEKLGKRLKAERERVEEQKQAADVMLSDARTKVDADSTAIAHARVRLTVTVVGILEFEKAATSASSPILGPTLLTAQQMADFVRAQAYTPRLTVPLDELAQDYVNEGNAAGVRGDVAFAQSILETGGFSFPGGGQVLINDNNFAGIGACDSCKHGFSFESALIGVRAQMQALRIYVDPDLTETTLKDPLVMPKMLNLGFRGRVQTWWDLWGTWATGAFYGQRVYDIYTRMVEFARTDAAHADPEHGYPDPGPPVFPVAPAAPAP